MRKEEAYLTFVEFRPVGLAPALGSSALAHLLHTQNIDRRNTCFIARALSCI